MQTLKNPEAIRWDERLPAKDRETIDKLNASVGRLNEMRALEINISGPFAKSKIAWKLAGYQHALLHRIVVLMDGVAIAWNNRSTLGGMMCARAVMETIAVMSSFERSVAGLLAREDMGGLDALAQNGTFASRDPEWLSDFPESKATNAVTYVDKFDDKILKGFRAHYDRLSERCHPNSLGHNFMFAKLDREEGTTSYSDETEPARNAHLIVAALTPVPLVESMMTRLDKNILAVAEFQHRVAPVGDKKENENS